MSEVKNIHEAIAAVMQQVGYVQKTKNANLNYSFAGEAALIGAIRPVLVENGVYMAVTDIADVTHEWYTTGNGKQMVNTTLRAVIRFTHAPSGTFLDVVALGEGSDTGDKSINKAMTGAYKYALRQTLCIETGDDPDNFASDGMERGKAAIPSKKSKHTQNELVAYAANKGFDNAGLGAILGKSGFTNDDLASMVRFDEMCAAIDAAATLVVA